MTPPHERRTAAVITGASSGVGRALALRFASSVQRVVLIGRDAARLEAVARDAESRGAEAICHVVHLDSAAEVDQLARELEALPAVSALLHAAGEFAAEPLATASARDLDRLLGVNLRAPYVLTHRLLRALEQGSGDVVFINSSVVGQRRAGVAAYAASKAGLVAVADSLRQECNPLGLRVLSVFLGATATPLQEQLHARAGRTYHPGALLQPADVAEIVHAALALPRGAEVTDLHLRSVSQGV
jgi:NADP-dependent 3-hydroxy acid dehydrogenase YdfG